ncbi:MAG TPA: family 16 glycosylhydrolase [Draconibacterium sp.]|nr:family 16 glycosylhydrolase [Draconibacterium sp.]
MKSILSLTILLLFVINCNSQTEKSTLNLSEENLVWSDEFEGTGIPDPVKWDRPEYNRRINSNGPDGWWSKEDSYLDGNGNLVIRVRKIANKNTDSDAYDYSVGAIRTKGKFEVAYGKFEIRCKLPTQKGWWVAFWMMQGNVGSVTNAGVDGSEVDIMEGFGWTDKINQAIHWDGYGTEHKSIGTQKNPSGIRNDFHTYTLEWFPEIYVFYIDGKETWRTKGGGVCNQKGYLKVTGEISTEDWAINQYWSNNPENAQYPDSFIVDYVRVYELPEIKTGIGSNDLPDNKLKIYPNPVQDNLNLEWSENQNGQSQIISILNNDGQVVKNISGIPGNTSICVEDLNSGYYILRAENDKSAVYRRFLKL